MDWFDFLAVQGTLKSLLQHHSSKTSILWHSAFFIVQLSHPYMTTGKIIALTRWTFVGKVISLLFNMLSRLVIAFLSECLLPHYSCGLGIWAWLSWVLWLSISPQGFNKVSTRAVVSSEGSTRGESVSKLTHLAVGR